eukprot:augustus_masked-scaffold_12-processed-gene-3.7-mRNA-1 protein AED:1.00 eAED:1.00 QI:0/-1/0/0/-1/1/1/0/297
MANPEAVKSKCLECLLDGDLEGFVDVFALFEVLESNVKSATGNLGKIMEQFSSRKEKEEDMDRIQLYLDVADQFAQYGRREHMIYCFDKVIEVENDSLVKKHTEVFALSAKVNQELGNLTKAAKHMENYFKLTNDEEGKDRLKKIYLEEAFKVTTGTERRTTLLEKCTNLFPHNEEIMLKFAHALYENDQPKNALEVLEDVEVTKEPLLRAKCLEAISSFEEALEIVGDLLQDSEEARQLSSRCLLQLGRLKEASEIELEHPILAGLVKGNYNFERYLSSIVNNEMGSLVRFQLDEA